ncbi:MAG: prephenate dehydrogenase/arogenate dehydrogenase family protein [Planctomycetota bacterium]
MNAPSADPSPRLPRRLGVVGLGLLGGSVALAARRFAIENGNDLEIIGFARRAETRRWAMDNGMVDVVTDQVATVAACDLVVIATPVDGIAHWVIQVVESNPAASVTDVGSTKAAIVDQVSDDAQARRRFLAAHPIAGGENSGAPNAVAELFDGKPVVITRSGFEDGIFVDPICEFWVALGGRLVELSPAQHDRQLAVTSHLPHLMAALTARGVDQHASAIVGAGWLDTTRVAAGDPELWTAIVRQNRAAILDSLSNVRQDMDCLIDAIHSGDDAAVTRWLASAQAIRHSVVPSASRVG